MTSAYPFNSDDEVAAIRREEREAAELRGAEELWDFFDDYDRHRAYPTRPPDSELLPPAHFHEGCKHHCVSGAPGCASDRLCMNCQLSEPEGYDRRYRPLRKRA